MSSITTTPKQREPREQIFKLRSRLYLFVIISRIIFLGIILGAIYNTTLLGLPSISSMLATNIWLSGFTTMFIGIFIYITAYLEGEASLLFKQVPMVKGFQSAIYILTLGQFISILLVLVVRVTEYVWGHSVVAGFTVLFTLLLQATRITRQYNILNYLEDQQGKKRVDDVDLFQLMYGKTFSLRSYMYFNLFYVTVLSIFALAFFIELNVKWYPEVFTGISILEYILYGGIIYLKNFNALDIYDYSLIESHIIHPVPDLESGDQPLVTAEGLKEKKKKKKKVDDKRVNKVED
jgi:hypothetical protein